MKDKEKKKEYNKIYRENNKEKIREDKKKYRQDNKENIKEYKKEYRENNKEKIKEYRIKNKDKINNNYNNRKSNDILFKLKEQIKNSIYYSFKNNSFTKNSRTHEILGCSFNEFKEHIESQFESWMNWDNHGLYNGELNYGWDLDHIKPKSSAITEEDIIRLNHHTNFQPLCSKINRYVKKDKW